MPKAVSLMLKSRRLALVRRRPCQAGVEAQDAAGDEMAAHRPGRSSAARRHIRARRIALLDGHPDPVVRGLAKNQRLLDDPDPLCLAVAVMVIEFNRAAYGPEAVHA